MKVLAIGNSFSQDATHYLHQIAEADGVDLQVVNLYIGGCSLERHWRNIESGAKEYELELNGKSTGRTVSVQEALALEEWNVIVTQQASHDSGLLETYDPYIGRIIEFLKEQAPKAELMLHQTWAYEQDSIHSMFYRYGYSQQTMYEKLSSAYRTVANRLGLRLIPSGDMVQKLRAVKPFRYEEGGASLCRDGFHMNIIYGRYLLSAVWYKTLTHNSLTENSYVPHTELSPNAVCNESILRVIKEFVDTEMQ